MSYIQHNPDDYFNDRTLYAYTPKTFYRHGTTWGRPQDYDTITTFSQFSELANLSPTAETMHITTEVEFPQWHVSIEGHDYYAVTIYTSDKLLSPKGDTINAFIVDPLETEFVETNPMRPFDDFYPEIIKDLNDHYQLYLNLEKAAKYIEDTINLITPIKGNNLGIHDRQTNIAANVDTIVTKLPVSTLRKFFRAVDYFFLSYQELAHKSGTANIVKVIPANTDYLPLLNFYNYIDAAFTPGFSAGGTRQETFHGVITSFYYQNPDVAFRQWFQLARYTYPSPQLLLSREVLSELGLTAPVQKTDWITSIEGTRGKWNINGINNNWDNPLSLQEMEEGFGKNKLEKLTVEERTGTSATISLEFFNDWFDKFYEVGLVYSATSPRPGFQSYSNSIPASQFLGLVPNEGVSYVSRTDVFEYAKSYKGLKVLYNLENLTANTTYHVRPFILFKTYYHGQFDGYFLTYLDDFTFSTDLAIPLTPYIEPGLNAEVTDITQLTAKVTVKVGSTYEGAIPERGILISSTNPIPEFKNGNIKTPGEANMRYKTDSLSDDYVVFLTSLSRRTKYYVRPYLVTYPTFDSEPVIIYGDAITFGTQPLISIPFISLSGNKTADGEGIDIKVDATVQYDDNEDTLFYYYIQALTEAIPNEIPAQAKLIGKKDHTVSSYSVSLSAQVSITGLVKGLYRLVVMSKNSSGIGHNSLRFGAGIDSSTVSAETINTPVTTQSAPTAMISAEIVSNAYVKMSAYITKLGSTFEWAKLKVLSADKTTTFFEKDIVATFDDLTGLVRYGLWNIQVSALAVNTSFVAQVSVKTSYISAPALFEQTFTTPATWDLTYLYKPINPVLTKTVKTNTSDITVKTSVVYNDNIEAGGKMTLCIYKPGATNGQPYNLSNYTEKREIIATKGQKEFIFDLNFTENTTYTFVAFYTDTDTRVYNSSYIQHSVELADVSAFTKYRIFYNLNGAEGTISPTEGSPNSTVFVTSEIPVREGYTFGGWNTAQYGSGTSYASGNSIAIASSDIMLYAQWISSKVTVTFDTVGGSFISSQLINKGSKCTQPAVNPTRTGYVFSHWYESNGNMSARFDFSTPIQANKTLYALWISEQASWGVVFDTKGGGLISTQTVLHNQKATKPTNPTRAGYYFVAWYKDEAYQNEYDFNTPVTGAIILYAKWSQSKFTVTFNSNGGTAVASQEVAAGGLVQRPAKPTKADKYFVDWATTSSEDYNVDTVLYDFNTPVTANITLYACWATLTGTVVFEYNILKYTDANVKISQERYVAEGLIAGERVISKNSYETPPAVPTLDGYIFDGWYYINNENPTNGENAPETLNWGINMLPFDFTQRVVLEYGITLFTKWKKGTISHTVSFNTGTGATVIRSQQVINGGFVIKPATPSREGYTFKHWYVSGDNTQTAYNFSTPVTAGLILVALWLPNYQGTTKQVTFNTNGGSAIATKEVASGGICTKPTDPTKSNYKFIDWYTDIELTESFDFNTVITEDITLYAKWEVIVVDKEIFNPPADAVPGQKYYFYDRIWVRDATDNRWRLDYKAMYEEMQSAANPVEKAKVRTLSQNVVDYKQEISSLQEQVETLDKKNTEALQMTFNLLNENQNVVNNLNALYDTHIINLKRGQYLTDALDYINQVGDATAENPYTINFYNHSKTINWDNFTEKIPWPRHVYLNFVGDINLWGDYYELGMPASEFGTILTGNKLFLGFDFNRTPPVGHHYRSKSGLPSNISKLFFGGLDESNAIVVDYEDYNMNQETLGIGSLELLYIIEGGENEGVLLKKRNGVLLDITPNFNWCDLSGYDLTGAYFLGAIMQYAILKSCKLSFSDFSYVDLKGAKLEGVFAYSSNFYHSRLVNTNFYAAEISNSSFYGATMTNSYFTNAQIKRCNFSSGLLNGTDFRGSNLEGSYFTNANLDNIIVDSRSNFKGVDLTGAISLPTGLDTKAKFIAAVGAGNVDATTLWIDGTSILA